ncbi:MAG: NTP transferase domain-containing protein, partial [Acidimicrobiales bacterium]
MVDLPLSAVVLAAGEGTRMHSSRPKPLHRLCGRPMILHVLDALAELHVHKVVVVVGHRGEWVTKTLIDHAPDALSIEFVEQPEQLGTGDALAVGLTALPEGASTATATWSSFPATPPSSGRRRSPPSCGTTVTPARRPPCSPPDCQTPTGTTASSGAGTTPCSGWWRTRRSAR